jgi:hypothetical protein
LESDLGLAQISFTHYRYQLGVLMLFKHINVTLIVL